MTLPPSTANWHWKTKYVTPWGRTWFQQELTQLRVTGKDLEEASITKVTEVEGDIELGQRKSKLITIYDCRVSLDWSGTASDGTEVSGSLTIPEVSHENSVDGLSEYVFEWQLNTTRSSSVDALFELVKTQLRSAIETKLAEFPVALVDTHGKDLTVSAEPSRSGTPANGTAPRTPSSNPTSVQSDVTKSAKKATAINTEVVSIESTFQAPADELYSLFVDESRIPIWSRAPAQSKAEVGGSFSLFGGGVKGEYKSLKPGKEIVQSWILNNPKWPSDHAGTMTITFDQQTDSTTVKFKLAGVPTGLQDETSQNLQGYYIQGLKAIGLGSQL